jgi:hypothetical protein
MNVDSDITVNKRSDAELKCLSEGELGSERCNSQLSDRRPVVIFVSSA